MKLVRSIVFGLFGIALAASVAYASTSYFTHGSNCFVVSGGAVTYGQFGINPNTGTASTIMCPLPDSWNANSVGTPYSIGAGGYDRSSTADLACSVVGTDGFGNINAIVSGSTSGNAATSKSFTISGNTAGFTYFTCTIPGSTSSGFSHFTGYTPTL